MTLTQNPSWFRVAVDPKAIELIATADLEKVVKFVIEFGVSLGCDASSLGNAWFSDTWGTLRCFKGLRRAGKLGTGKLVLFIKNGLCRSNDGMLKSYKTSMSVLLLDF